MTLKSPRGKSTDSKPPTYHHGDLAEALKRQTLRLVAQHGIEGFSLREAAAALKVTPGAVYKHFTSKTDLLLAVADDGFAELAVAFASHVKTVPKMDCESDIAVARLQAIGRAYLGFALRHPARFVIMFSMAEECTKRRKQAATTQETAEAESAAYRILQTVVAGLTARGHERAMSDGSGETLAWASIHGLTHLMVSGMVPFASRGDALTAMNTTTLLVANVLKLNQRSHA
jgi:AcrR family transcriptional regulator